MIDFKKIGLEDRGLITPYLFMQKERDCNLSFVNLYTWQFLSGSSFAVVNDCLTIRFDHLKEHTICLMLVGTGDKHPIVVEEEEQALSKGCKMRIYGVFPDLGEWLDREFPGRFTYHNHRDYFDYIYLRQDLIELRGKDYQPKRNHVNKFRKTYDYTYKPLTKDLIPHCLELEEKWCIEHNCEESESLGNERKALTRALHHFDELELYGGTIWVDGEIVAFTYGSPITKDTFDIHIEKANFHIEGSYNIINQEFASHIPEQYIYINREEDLGIPGLRKSKLSYRPITLLEKGYAELIG